MVVVLVGAGLLVVVALGTLSWAWVAPRLLSHARLQSAAREGAPARLAARRETSGAARPRDRAAAVASLLSGLGWHDTLQLELLRAGWLLRPSEFAVVSGLAGLGLSAALMLLTQSMFMGIVGLAIGGATPWMVVKNAQSKRDHALSAQIPDMLDMLCSALRSGFSFARGLQLVKSQMHPPISEEFGRVLEEVQFGVSLSQALDGVVMRTRNYDLELIVAAVQTQLELGGNLAEVLGNIAEMVRERVKLAGEIATATAEGRFSAGILLALPIAIALIINVVSPGYLAPLFTTPLGHVLLGVGSGLMILGSLVIKRLITIDM